MEKTLDQAGSYREWKETALALDKLEGKDKWRLEPESSDYDYHLLKSRIRLFRKLCKQKDYDQLIFRLREELHGPRPRGDILTPLPHEKEHGLEVDLPLNFGRAGDDRFEHPRHAQRLHDTGRNRSVRRGDGGGHSGGTACVKREM